MIAVELSTNGYKLLNSLSESMSKARLQPEESKICVQTVRQILDSGLNHIGELNHVSNLYLNMKGDTSCHEYHTKTDLENASLEKLENLYSEEPVL